MNHNMFEDVCPIKSLWIIVEPLQKCWTVCLSVLWENNLSCMGCSTNGVGNDGPTADVQYLEFSRGWVGLVELVHLFQSEEVKWMQIRGTVVLKIVLRVKLVPIVLSEQNLFCGPVGRLKQFATIISPSTLYTRLLSSVRRPCFHYYCVWNYCYLNKMQEDSMLWWEKMFLNPCNISLCVCDIMNFDPVLPTSCRQAMNNT